MTLFMEQAAPTRSRVAEPVAAAHNFETVVDALPQAAALIGARGRVTRRNDAWEQLFGADESLVEASRLEEYRQRQIEAARHHEGLTTDWVLRAGGSVRVRCDPLPPDNAANAKWLAVAIPPEQHHSPPRDALRQEVAQAHAASDAKDRFLAMISHELRTPLTPALVTLTNLRRDVPSGPQGEAIRHDLDVVRRCIELEARIIDDLLDLTRVAQGELKVHVRPLDLNVVAAETAELARPAAEAGGLTLDVRLDAADANVTADPDRLRQVLWNLLSNATKFNRPGGRIELQSCNPEPGLVRVAVRDTGFGIDAAELPSLFTAFEQLDHRQVNRFGGLGLGLTINKGLLKLQGGKLWAESAGRGQGSRFVIDFPTDSATAPNQPEPAVGATPAHNGPRGILPPAATAEPSPLDILLVDDHAETLTAMRRLLSRLGHRVTPAASVAEAREALADREDRPFDLLVSDIGLPDGSGLEVPPMLEDLWPERRVPSIALSGFGMSRDLDASRDAGFAVHLVKPVSLDQLQAVIARVIAAGRN